MTSSSALTAPCIVWFRQDLRLEDNPALQAALDRGSAVIPVFIHAPQEEGAWRPGEASDWWLRQSLEHLDELLQKHCSRLILRSGRSLKELQKLVQETNASAVYWNRRYEPALVARDNSLKAALRNQGLHVESFNSHLLYEPWEVATGSGRPYQVFTPFWRSCQKRDAPLPPVPFSPDTKIPAPDRWPESNRLDDMPMAPTRAWTSGLHDVWQPGAGHAAKRLTMFLDQRLGDYPSERDFPARPGTSLLSPNLHFGELSPRTIWHTVQSRISGTRSDSAIAIAGQTYLKEIGWREFAHHVLYYFPKTIDQPLRPEFANFRWEDNRPFLLAWQRGQTGYPIVDAGMRELWQTGWMHNRVRMIVASFLVKDLRIHWQRGAQWFWDTLVDADLANNTLGWQWSAGCGADAAPYFRVFNPVLQSRKFDPDGHYLRQWIPELNGLPTKWLHAPWTAPDEMLRKAGIVLGKTYPLPLVDHGDARAKALAAFEQIKGS